MLQPQRLTPGIPGYSAEPLDPNEALVLENWEVRRDGRFRARAGLTRVAGFNSPIIHLSQLPPDNATYSMAIVEGGRLRVSDSSGTNTNLGSGWPTSGSIKSTIGGNSANSLYWLAPRTSIYGPNSPVYKITPSNSLAAISSSSSQWVENYGVYTFRLDGTDN